MGRRCTPAAVVFWVLFRFTCIANANWDGIIPVNSTATTDGLNDGEYASQIATDGAGNSVVVWQGRSAGPGTDDDIYVSWSSNNGQTWSDTEMLNSGGATDASHEHDSDAQIATDKTGNWICVWSMTGSLSQDIGMSRSTDNGATWSTTQPVNSDATTVAIVDSYPFIATDGNGIWICTWSRAGVDDIYYSVSVDNGASWSELQVLNGDAQAAGENIHACAATDGSGNWIICWQSKTGFNADDDNDTDIHLARSSNSGESWSNVSVANNDSAMNKAEDNAPSIASNGVGHWVIVWSSKQDLNGNATTDYDIHSATSSDNGATWSDPVAVNSNHLADTGFDLEPHLSTDDDGTWLTAWYANNINGSDYDIYYSVSVDNGATWSRIAPLNSDATTDEGYDSSVCTTANGSGGWLTVWNSNNLSGPSGPDLDILSSRADSLNALSLTAPNGGEKWKMGKKETITWDSTGSTGDNVRIELLRNGNVIQPIMQSTPNDGKQKWKLPASLDQGAGYKVRISDKSNAAISDTSDGNFRIKSAK